ncbi:DUF892 family protein [Erwinia rhapontici]|uniref:DUF892 family protein n=1 Tax=Erwinia rhapontici TaxID=55212 RepID=UPI001D0DB8FD|nr:DUF892 family protein [Erwinia rhapontici]UDQ78728.1 DUF892 family protein [Erwinia rhapontici]
MQPEKCYHTWFRDACAIERHAEVALNELTQHLTPWPEMKARVDNHLRETRENISMLSEFMQRRQIDSVVLGGERFSHFKNCIQGINGLLMSPEPVNNFIGSYLLEAYEIGCLTPLIAAAEALGDQEAILLLDKIIQKDFNMVRWALEHLPDITRAQLFAVETPTKELSSELH